MIKKLFFVLLLLFTFSSPAFPAILTSYETGKDGQYELGCGGAGCAAQERRAAQSFQLASNSTITDLDIYATRSIDGGNSGVSIRIETNNAGVPSGTLAHANATCAIAHADIPNTNPTFDFEPCVFASSFDLNASTTYWIVAKMTTPVDDKNYYWGTDSSSPGYASGNGATSIIGSGSQPSFTAQAGDDTLFKVNGTVASGRRRIIVVS